MTFLVYLKKPHWIFFPQGTRYSYASCIFSQIPVQALCFFSKELRVPSIIYIKLSNQKIDSLKYIWSYSQLFMRCPNCSLPTPTLELHRCSLFSSQWICHYSSICCSLSSAKCYTDGIVSRFLLFRVPSCGCWWLLPKCRR